MTMVQANCNTCSSGKLQHMVSRHEQANKPTYSRDSLCAVIPDLGLDQPTSAAGKAGRVRSDWLILWSTRWHASLSRVAEHATCSTLGLLPLCVMAE